MIIKGDYHYRTMNINQQHNFMSTSGCIWNNTFSQVSRRYTLFHHAISEAQNGSVLRVVQSLWNQARDQTGRAHAHGHGFPDALRVRLRLKTEICDKQQHLTRIRALREHQCILFKTVLFFISESNSHILFIF